MNKRIAIYGASGHGKVVADIAETLGYTVTTWIDDGENEFLSYGEFIAKYGDTVPVALGVGDNLARKKIYQKLSAQGIETVTLIHPRATVSGRARLENGTVIMPGAVINADATIGQGVIVNSGAVIEHDCTLGAFSHVSPNAALGGNVNVGSLTHVGIGSSLIQGITVGSRCIVGAGAVVIENIEDYSLAVGVPAKSIKKFDAK